MDTQKITSEIKQIISKINFPVHKDEIMNKASNVSQETKQELQKLPNQTFNSAKELLSKLSFSNIKEKLGSLF